MTKKSGVHILVSGFLSILFVIVLVSIGELVKALLSDQQVLIDQLQHYISG